jgi:hypothetical protein
MADLAIQHPVDRHGDVACRVSPRDGDAGDRPKAHLAAEPADRRPWCEEAFSVAQSPLAYARENVAAELTGRLRGRIETPHLPRIQITGSLSHSSATVLMLMVSPCSLAAQASSVSLAWIPSLSLCTI